MEKLVTVIIPAWNAPCAAYWDRATGICVFW